MIGVFQSNLFLKELSHIGAATGQYDEVTCKAHKLRALIQISKSSSVALEVRHGLHNIIFKGSGTRDQTSKPLGYPLRSVRLSQFDQAIDKAKALAQRL